MLRLRRMCPSSLRRARSGRWMLRLFRIVDSLTDFGIRSHPIHMPRMPTLTHPIRLTCPSLRMPMDASALSSCCFCHSAHAINMCHTPAVHDPIRLTCPSLRIHSYIIQIFIHMHMQINIKSFAGDQAAHAEAEPWPSVCAAALRLHGLEVSNIKNKSYAYAEIQKTKKTFCMHSASRQQAWTRLAAGFHFSDGTAAVVRHIAALASESVHAESSHVKLFMQIVCITYHCP